MFGSRRSVCRQRLHAMVASAVVMPLRHHHHSHAWRRSPSALVSSHSTARVPLLSSSSRCYTKDESPFPLGPKDKEKPYALGQKLSEEHPIVQLPARSLWCQQYALNPDLVRRGDFDDMIRRVEAARHYYRYPSLCAPQIGWNVQLFVLFDGTVYINPVNVDAAAWKAEAQARGLSETACEEANMAELRRRGQTGFAWEPCASSCFLMHYIERPLTLHLRALNAKGEPVEETLTGMRARMALHELDHLGGVLFTRRVVDANHVVPLEGFSLMSDWSDDYPSLEARSTNLYTLFTPPFRFASEGVPDANLLERKFEDGIYPGCEHDRQMRIEGAAYEDIQRSKFRKGQDEAEASGGGGAAGRVPAEAATADEDDDEDSSQTDKST